ncbi:MAG: flippase-like domain-containing protein [Dehalococcoidia bacterium]|nr:flippase-like domain-containing protein [Dehalococcoidia bacterium]
MLAIAIVAGVAVFVVLAFLADAGQVGRALASFQLSYIPLILGLTVLNYVLRFCKWHFYLGCIDIRLGLRRSALVFLSGLAMVVTPAKIGEVFKSYLLKRLEGIQISRTVPVVFAERATDALGLLALAGLSLSALWYGPVPIVVCTVVLLGLVAILQSRSFSLRLIALLDRLPFLRRFSGSLYTAYESAYSLMRLRPLTVALFLSVVSWGFECLALHFVLKGLAVQTPLSVPTFVLSFSSIAGTLSMIPGGLGVAEGSMTGLLIMAGTTASVAAAATVIIRLCTLWFGMLVGVVALGRTMRNAGGKPAHT